MSLSYYCPKHFDPREFVPPEVYKALGDRCILVMDYRMLKTADQIREFFGLPCIINNWHTGKDRKYSGFRPFRCTVGATWSQHRFGRALDMIIPTIDANDARSELIKAPKRFPYVTCMEDNVKWLHVDCRAIVGDGEIQLIQS